MAGIARHGLSGVEWRRPLSATKSWARPEVERPRLDPRNMVERRRWRAGLHARSPPPRARPPAAGGVSEAARARMGRAPNRGSGRRRIPGLVRPSSRAGRRPAPPGGLGALAHHAGSRPRSRARPSPPLGLGGRPAARASSGNGLPARSATRTRECSPPGSGRARRAQPGDGGSARSGATSTSMPSARRRRAATAARGCAASNSRTTRSVRRDGAAPGARCDARTWSRRRSRSVIAPALERPASGPRPVRASRPHRPEARQRRSRRELGPQPAETQRDQSTDKAMGSPVTSAITLRQVHGVTPCPCGICDNAEFSGAAPAGSPAGGDTPDPTACIDILDRRPPRSPRHGRTYGTPEVLSRPASCRPLPAGGAGRGPAPAWSPWPSARRCPRAGPTWRATPCRRRAPAAALTPPEQFALEAIIIPDQRPADRHRRRRLCREPPALDAFRHRSGDPRHISAGPSPPSAASSCRTIRACPMAAPASSSAPTSS